MNGKMSEIESRTSKLYFRTSKLYFSQWKVVQSIALLIPDDLYFWNYQKISILHDFTTVWSFASWNFLQSSATMSSWNDVEILCIYKGKSRILQKSLIFIMGKCLEMTSFQDVLDDMTKLYTGLKSRRMNPFW